MSDPAYVKAYASTVAMLLKTCDNVVAEWEAKREGSDDCSYRLMARGLIDVFKARKEGIEAVDRLVRKVLLKPEEVNDEAGCN
jgi:hypothetical protein